MNAPGQFIGGCWSEGGGDPLVSTDPASEVAVWEGRSAATAEVDAAVAAASAALPAWRDRSVAERWEVLEAYAEQLRSVATELAHWISAETGKPRWESRGEVAAMVAKIAVSRTAFDQRIGETRFAAGAGYGVLYQRPVGVLGVLGPFNLPGHLPNGHLVPALLCGNTAVLKPSEYTPRTAVAMVRCWQDAGLPAGVLNLVQGAAEVGRSLAGHPRLDGLLFTGSYAVGRVLHRQFGGYPEKVLALEMGGNNPLVVWESKNPPAAARIALLSAFITAGQRCTCARRLILPRGGEGDAVLEHLLRDMGALRVGPCDQEPEPFMGPLISTAALRRLLALQERLEVGGGQVLARMRPVAANGAFLCPGVIDVSGLDEVEDEEWFGPLLLVQRVADFPQALRAADRTAYGLAAGLVSAERSRFETFRAAAHAGVLAWNRPTTGASGQLPFGGVGHSGNHRPSGYWAVDYCSDPVASLEVDQVEFPAEAPPGLPDPRATQPTGGAGRRA